jgi:hypothetical protein
MKARAKRIWLLSIDAITVLILLLFNVSVIIVLGIGLMPIILWRVFFGTKEEIKRFQKEGVKKNEGEDTSKDR